ncbi:MAG: redoxin domain-containing protein [Flavobacteriaceae bacterium]
MRFIHITIVLFLMFSFNKNETIIIKGLSVGDKIPSFSLTDDKGHSFDSKDYKDKQCLILFFFKHESRPTCNDDICNFRDSFNEFSNLNAKIAGISSDYVTTLNNYSLHNKINYSLLSDHKKRVRKLFGFKKSLLKSNTSKVVYIVNKKGEILYIFNSHKEVQENETQILNALNLNK